MKRRTEHKHISWLSCKICKTGPQLTILNKTMMKIMKKEILFKTIQILPFLDIKIVSHAGRGAKYKKSKMRGEVGIKLFSRALKVYM